MSRKLDEYTKEELLAYIGKLKKDIKFGLVWNPKDEQVTIDCDTKVPVLQEVADRTIIKVNNDNPPHLLIEGDNYHSLSVLNYTHAGKVDVIYIDPPYNTGNKDFIYNDHYVDREDPYRHSEWLSFMDNRLRLAKNLLADTGVIFISIDDNEQAHLRILCDTIFGEEHFIGCFIRRTINSGRQDSTTMSAYHEYLLVYAKNAKSIKLNRRQKTDDERVRLYPLEDKYLETRGRHYISQLDKGSIQYSDSLNYPITAPDGAAIWAGKGFDDKSRCFRWSKEKVQWGLDNDYIVFKKQKTGWKVYAKSYEFRDNNDNKISPSNPYTSLDYVAKDYSNFNATPELQRIFNGEKVFNNPKPVIFIEDLIRYAASKTAIVLDFFAGSGTTGHAVLKLNAQDGGKRQFILGTNNENGIAENITYERINKVINGYNSTAGIPANLYYFKTDFVETSGLSVLTDHDKLEIAREMGAMIALRENSFKQLEQTDHWQTYENATQLTAIYFREDKTKITEYLDRLNAQDKPVKLYVFCWGKNAGTEYASRKISVEDIPEPLIEVYKEIAK